MQILWPMLAMFLLTLVITIRLAYTRVSAAKSGQIDPKYFRLMEENYVVPDHIKALARNYSNQFEMPILFYIACVLAYITNGAWLLTVGLAWLYVALRALHAWVHVGSNRVMLRFKLFAASVLTLALLWLCIFARLI